MDNFDWDSWIKEATRYKPCASLWIDKENDRIELLLDTTAATYGEWIPGEGADISLVRCGKTNKVIGVNLPLYQTDFSIFHTDGIQVAYFDSYLEANKVFYEWLEENK